MKLLHSLIGLATFLICFQTLAQPLMADENFSSSLASTYTIEATGDTLVEHHLTITNKTPTLYTKQFALKISSLNIKNVTVTSNGKTLTPNIVKTDLGTNIAMSFDDEVLGVDKKRTIDISYHDPDTALLTNKTLAVYIPKFQNSEIYDHYEVTLKTPLEFGLPTRTQPTNNQSAQAKGAIVTQFFDLHNQGISAQFGQEQYFQLHLIYHLENITNNPGISQIALPPDTAYQKLAYQALEPPPETIERDLDGNWIATYQMNAQSQIEISLDAVAKISLDPNPTFPTVQPVKEYLKSQPYWETEKSIVTQLADQLSSVEEIYRTVVETLQYNKKIDPDTATRQGAAAALADPTQAVCQEFTDTFIALARANQIPARRLTGYAYSRDNSLRPLSLVQDVLHAWPEYYDSATQHWIQVDPTWEQTTGGIDYFHQFDLNHIVFAINGISSTTPYPAGSYKTSQSQAKDVQVSFATHFPEQNTPPVLTIQPRKVGQLSIPGYYELQIKNTSGTAQYQLQLEPTLSNDSISSLETTQLPALLPFETKTVPIIVTTKSPLVSRPVRLQLQVNDQIQNFDLIAGPEVSWVFRYPTLLTAVGFSLVIGTLAAGSVLVFRRKK